jgi:hypothetical protein
VCMFVEAADGNSSRPKSVLWATRQRAGEYSLNSREHR